MPRGGRGAACRGTRATPLQLLPTNGVPSLPSSSAVLTGSTSEGDGIQGEEPQEVAKLRQGREKNVP